MLEILLAILFVSLIVFVPWISSIAENTKDSHQAKLKIKELEKENYDRECKKFVALNKEYEERNAHLSKLIQDKSHTANDQIRALKSEIEIANKQKEEAYYVASTSIEDYKNYLDMEYDDRVNQATLEERRRNHQALSEWINSQNKNAPLIPKNLIDEYAKSILTDRLDKAVFDQFFLTSQLSISCTISSGDNTYTTTLTSCTCPDHTIRHVVCKHMLALAAYVHAFTPYEGNIKELLDEIICNKKILAENRISNEKALQENQKIIKALEEKQQTYPYLAELIANYRAAKINARVRDPSTKRELISHIKTLEKEKAMMQNQIAVYEYMFPILHDFKEVPPQNLEKAISNLQGTGFQYQWLSPDEYAALTSHEKQQRWIDRYFRGRSNNAWEAGIKYERYIGYLCEKEGYRVKYSGALLKLNDMGRDLIVSKGKKIYIIQCKRFSDHKEIHENHLFQLFGTVTHYSSEHPEKKVIGVFVTSAALSPIASECAKSLSILCYEHIAFQEYPIIKCNLSRNGEKIYHLPFDQQYDTITIEETKGESYVSTVEEAESMGYRHAMRHLFIG